MNMTPWQKIQRVAVAIEIALLVVIAIGVWR